jgi:hypothetical protein
VDVWQHLDARLEVRYQGQSLATFEPATDAPVRVHKFQPAPGQEAPEKKPGAAKALKKPKVRKPSKPAADHPWRRPLYAKPKERNGSS